MRRIAITKIELLIIIGVILLLLAAFVPALLRAREHNRRVQCSSNLRLIGQAILLYSNDQRGGAFPRTHTSAGPDRTPTWGTNPAAKQPFMADGPVDNDVTAGLFLLLRTQEITPQAFICPSTNQVADDFAGLSAKQRSNFTSLRENLSYSYHNQYPDEAYLGRRWRHMGTLGAEYAVAADKNPGIKGGDNVLFSTARSSPMYYPPPPGNTPLANSNNHGKAGQNILYGDGHVAWESTAFAGTNRDNIYTTATGKIFASPYDVNDSILLPTDDD